MANTFTTSSSSCRPVFTLSFTSLDPVVRRASVVSGQTLDEPVYGIADAFDSLLGDRLGETGVKLRHLLELVVREVAVLRGLMDSLELLLHGINVLDTETVPLNGLAKGLKLGDDPLLLRLAGGKETEGEKYGDDSRQPDDNPILHNPRFFS